MKKIRFLTFVITALLVINALTLGFIYFKSDGPARERRPEPKDIITRKLHFDAGQQEEYEGLIQWHRGEIDRLDMKIREAKRELYTRLNSDTPDIAATDSLFVVIAQYQKEVEQVHYKHFADIKKLCRPGQMQYYSRLTKELAHIFAPPSPGRPE